MARRMLALLALLLAVARADDAIELAIREAVQQALLRSMPEPEPEPEPELPEPEPEPDTVFEQVSADSARGPREAFTSMIYTFAAVFGCVLLTQLSRAYSAFRKNHKRAHAEDPSLEWRWSRKPYKWRYVPTDPDARQRLEAWEDTKYCAGRCCCSRACCAGGTVFLVIGIILSIMDYNSPDAWPPWAAAAPNTTEPWPGVCRAADGTKVPEYSTEAACVGAWTCSVPELGDDCTRGACLLPDATPSTCSRGSGGGRRQLTEQDKDTVAVCTDPLDGICGAVGMILCGGDCVPPRLSSSFAASCSGNRCADVMDGCGSVGMVTCGDKCVPLGSVGQTCAEMFAAAGNVAPADCPLGCEYSDGWEPEVIVTTNRTIVSFVFAGDVSVLSGELEEFVAGFQAAVSAVLGGIRLDRVVVDKVRPGSIVVDFWLQAATLRGEPTTASLLQQIETQAADGTLVTAIALQAHQLPMLPSVVLVGVETFLNSQTVTPSESAESFEFVVGLGCLDHSIVFPSFCNSADGTLRVWMIGTQGSNNFTWEEAFTDAQIQAIVSARMAQAEADGVFIHTHHNLDEDEPGYNSTEWAARIGFNLRHLGVFLDLRYPCGVEWREYFDGSSPFETDFFGGLEALITCDGMSLSTHLGGYWAAGTVWMILGSPLICKMPRTLPDLNHPDSMLALLKRPSRALSGFLLLVSIGTLVSIFHQFIAKGRFTDPVTVDIWLVTFGFFCGGVVPVLPALCCSYCHQLNETRKNTVFPQAVKSGTKLLEIAEHSALAMMQQGAEADEAEARAAEEQKQAEEAIKLAEQEMLDVELAQKQLQEANQSGDQEKIEKARAALQKEEEEAKAAEEVAEKEAKEAKEAAEVAERERAEAIQAEDDAKRAMEQVQEANLSREEIQQIEDMKQAQRLVEEDEIEDVGEGVNEGFRAVFNLMGGRGKGYLTSREVKRGLRKYLQLHLTRRELKNLIGQQLEDDRLYYSEFVGLVTASAEAARRAGQDDEVMSDSTYSQSDFSAAKLSFGLQQKLRESQSSFEGDSPIIIKETQPSGTNDIKSQDGRLSLSSREKVDRWAGGEGAEAEDAESNATAAEEMSQNYEVAAQLGKLAQQLAVLQEHVVQKQLALLPKPPPRKLPPLKLGPPPARERTAMDDLKDWFDRVDADRSGSIGADELRVAVQEKVGRFVDKETIDHLLSQADKNGDGAVDWKEFLRMAEEHGWAAAAPEEKSEPPFAWLSCSADSRWVFHIRSKSRKAILGRMPGNPSPAEDEIGLAGQDHDPEDRINLDDPHGEQGNSVRCILPCDGLSKELTRKISRRHCEIAVHEENGHWRWTVQALSGNQFLHNGIGVTQEDGCCPLQSYDRIGIGPLVVVFHPEGGDTAAQIAAQAAASTAAALTSGGVEIDPEEHAQHEQMQFAEFLTRTLAHVEAKLDVRLATVMEKLAPEPEPESEPESEPEPELEIDEERDGAGDAAGTMPPSKRDAERLMLQLGIALQNYEGYYGPNQNDWTAAEKLTAAALCNELATAYDNIDLPEFATECRLRAEKLRSKAMRSSSRSKSSVPTPESIADDLARSVRVNNVPDSMEQHHLESMCALFGGQVAQIVRKHRPGVDSDWALITMSDTECVSNITSSLPKYIHNPTGEFSKELLSVVEVMQLKRMEVGPLALTNASGDSHSCLNAADRAEAVLWYRRLVLGGPKSGNKALSEWSDE